MEAPTPLRYIHLPLGIIDEGHSEIENKTVNMLPVVIFNGPLKKIKIKT